MHETDRFPIQFSGAFAAPSLSAWSSGIFNEMMTLRALATP
jgi:hypothetical protein